LKKNEVEVWAVSTDPVDGDRGQRAYAEYLKAWFPLLPHTGRNLCLLYGVTQSSNHMATRMSVFICKDGIVKWIDKQINPKTHGADVMAEMHEMALAE
jgi:peroxiredoxin